MVKGTTRVIVLTVVAALAAHAAIPSAASAPTVTQILDTYSKGSFDDAVRTAASMSNLEQFAARFIVEAPAWIRSDPASIHRRRAAAAAFVVELTHARLESDWKLLRDLIEWSCADMRAAGAPTAFERPWHLAALALSGRARDRLWLLGIAAALPGERLRSQPRLETSPLHMYHVAERFPEDARLRLEWITAWTWGRDREPPRGLDARLAPFQTARRARQVSALDALAPLASRPDTAGDALLRIAQLQFVLNEFHAGLDAARRGRDAATDADGRYIAHMIAARALEAMSRHDEAKREYERAVETIPGAESAAIALAALKFADDDRATALAVLDRSFTSRPRADDPWRLFAYGNFHRWPYLLAAMRAELR
jgi:tetratricopeptide (TPR) repeat protein